MSGVVTCLVRTAADIPKTEWTCSIPGDTHCTLDNVFITRILPTLSPGDRDKYLRLNVEWVNPADGKREFLPTNYQIGEVFSDYRQGMSHQVTVYFHIEDN